MFNVTISSGWGSTETTGITVSKMPHLEYRPDSIGQPCPYYEAKVVSEQGEEVPPMKSAKCSLRGPAVCREYFKNPLETAAHMKDGWMHTGDLVRKDEDGFYFFVTRKSRMIKVAGLRVYPAEIEELLASHPDVLEAAVVKMPDDALGEVPKAVVVLKPETKVAAQELRLFCSEQVAKYKIPAVVDIVEALPKNPGGKILYKML